jgi:hypothetical protein
MRNLPRLLGRREARGEGDRAAELRRRAALRLQAATARRKWGEAGRWCGWRRARDPPFIGGEGKRRRRQGGARQWAGHQSSGAVELSGGVTGRGRGEVVRGVNAPTCIDGAATMGKDGGVRGRRRREVGDGPDVWAPYVAERERERGKSGGGPLGQLGRARC